MHPTFSLIPLTDLKVSKLNVRKHGSQGHRQPRRIDCRSIGASLQPLIVRAKDDGYEIIAGQRRFWRQVARDTDDPDAPDTVPCVVLDR